MSSPSKESKARVEQLIATFGSPKQALYRLDAVTAIVVQENDELHKRVKELTKQLEALKGGAS